MNQAMKRKPQTSKNEWEAIPAVEDLEQNGTEEGLFSSGVSSADAAHLLALHGPNELPEKVIPKWYIFLSLFWEPMPVMIWIAIIIEAILCKWMDMSILLAIQFANASIAFYETTKSGDAVAALKASLRPEATVKRDGIWKAIDASYLVPGDLVLLANGSAVPADCRLNDGYLEIDQAALTGESMPVTMYKGDTCRMGSTVVRGEVEGTVDFTGAKTFFGRTASLLQDDGELSNLQNMLLDIMIVLVVISLVLCSIVYLHLAHITSVVEALSFTVVLMVASIPLAIEIVTTTTLALGSKELSNQGAIVTRLSAIEDMAGMAILCSDKTGTLTINKMVLQQDCPIYVKGESLYSLLRYAAMAAKWLEPPRDALDTLTLNAVDRQSLECMEQLEYMPFDPVVKRTEGTVRDKTTGKIFKTTKGAPHVILKLVNNRSVTSVVERDIKFLGERGIRTLAVAKTDDDGVWVMLGMLTFLDPPRPDTLQTIQEAKRCGVAVKMITGDHNLIARETARKLTLGHRMMSSEVLPVLDPVTRLKPPNLARDYGEMILEADGFAEVFPEHKYLIVECLREMGYKTGMTGDGVNDAPALKRADIGIAVQGSTDAARAAADIVLTEPGLSTIVHGIMVARCIFIRIRNFITYRIAATLQLLLFFFMAIFAFRPSEYEPEDQDDHTWPEFFHMPVIMLMLITLLNDGTLIAIGYDNVQPPATPAIWNLRVLFIVGMVLAAVACASSMLLLYFSLDSWQEGSFYQVIGLGGVSYGQITTSIYLKVSVSDFLTLFSARAGEDWFWTSRPAPILLGAGAFALTISTIVACIWPMSRPDGIPTLGLEKKAPYILPVFIWVYCLVWWIIQDAAKVYTFKLIKAFNLFQYNDTGMVPNHSTEITLPEMFAHHRKSEQRDPMPHRPPSSSDAVVGIVRPTGMEMNDGYARDGNATMTMSMGSEPSSSNSHHVHSRISASPPPLLHQVTQGGYSSSAAGVGNGANIPAGSSLSISTGMGSALSPGLTVSTATNRTGSAVKPRSASPPSAAAAARLLSSPTSAHLLGRSNISGLSGYHINAVDKGHNAGSAEPSFFQSIGSSFGFLGRSSPTAAQSAAYGSVSLPTSSGSSVEEGFGTGGRSNQLFKKGK